ncbi:hypothetical protein E2I00_004565 [Balaenoptera physalus]|uniref:Chemokine interleukin-8-like domain-containing protein n=1 Tax=Balaenoptera physalus TaxID=9770 RepID=A0A643C788_BALPH|nr:hypothetical protein E2I00_004565 [Balaenoptera physalus]
MKVPAAALAVLLCPMALYSQVFSAPLEADTLTACCFSYTAWQLPRKFVADYFETNSQCSKPGVMREGWRGHREPRIPLLDSSVCNTFVLLQSFQTKRGRQLCANPSEDWVQEYITDLELNA